jgi:hypothetical protein
MAQYSEEKSTKRSLSKYLDDMKNIFDAKLSFALLSSRFSQILMENIGHVIRRD